jgi:ribosome-binding protein aMBF1 (putative translation factor)
MSETHLIRRSDNILGASLRELFADVREQIQVSGLSEEELDAKIESAVNEVRKQPRA